MVNREDLVVILIKSVDSKWNLSENSCLCAMVVKREANLESFQGG